MAIKDKTSENPTGKGFGGTSDQQSDSSVTPGQLVQVIQSSAAQQAVTLVQQADQMFSQIEAAAAQAVVDRESQVGIRIMDQVAARLTQQASTDTLPADTAAFQGQLVQVLGEVTRSANWQKCSASEMARRSDLFLSPAAMMGSAKSLPSA